MERFCISPDLALPIADRLVKDACDLAGRDLARNVNRLHKFIGAYPVSAQSEESLASLKEYLIELTWKVDEILSVQSPGEIVRPLQAAE